MWAGSFFKHYCSQSLCQPLEKVDWSTSFQTLATVEMTFLRLNSLGSRGILCPVIVASTQSEVRVYPCSTIICTQAVIHTSHWGEIKAEILFSHEVQEGGVHSNFPGMITSYNWYVFLSPEHLQWVCASDTSWLLTGQETFLWLLRLLCLQTMDSKLQTLFKMADVGLFQVVPYLSCVYLQHLAHQEESTVWNPLVGLISHLQSRIIPTADGSCQRFHQIIS